MTLTLHIAGQTLLSQLKVLNISISVAIEEEIIDSYLYEFLIITHSNLVRCFTMMVLFKKTLKNIECLVICSQLL